MIYAPFMPAFTRSDIFEGKMDNVSELQSEGVSLVSNEQVGNKGAEGPGGVQAAHPADRRISEVGRLCRFMAWPSVFYGLSLSSSSSTMASSLPPLVPPHTPIMLYIGAGFDLSPLLTFAPGGPPYPIAPLSTSTPSIEQPYTYTSFILVDAKPRHTFAYMVPDFKEWKTEEGRARNVLHYSQGMLDRWRTLPGAPDLILFEGGGTPEQRQARMHDSAWHFSKSPKCKRSVLHSRSRSVGPRQEQERSRPLTTLYYLFNTLDVEMMHAPRMERLWERVQALYVHGLKIHPRTGAGLGALRAGGFDTTIEEKPLPLSKSLKRCFVLVGSWSGKGGVQDVDFVLQARERERLRHAKAHTSHSHSLWSRYHDHPSTDTFASTRPDHTHPLCYSSSSSSPSSSVSSLSLAPITFYRPRTRGRRGLHTSVNRSYDSSFTSDEEEGKTSSVLDEWEWTDGDASFSSCSSPSPLSSLNDLSLSLSPDLDPFHIPIPQIAYSQKLWREGGGGKKSRERGRYFVMRSVSECLEVVHARERAEVGVVSA